jgi:hypothetical protein
VADHGLAAINASKFSPLSATGVFSAPFHPVRRVSRRRACFDRSAPQTANASGNQFVSIATTRAGLTANSGDAHIQRGRPHYATATRHWRAECRTRVPLLFRLRARHRSQSVSTRRISPPWPRPRVPEFPLRAARESAQRAVRLRPRLFGARRDGGAQAGFPGTCGNTRKPSIVGAGGNRTPISSRRIKSLEKKWRKNGSSLKPKVSHFVRRATRL